jgi:hypothetical protein
MIFNFFPSLMMFESLRFFFFGGWGFGWGWGGRILHCDDKKKNWNFFLVLIQKTCKKFLKISPNFSSHKFGRGGVVGETLD